MKAKRTDSRSDTQAEVEFVTLAVCSKLLAADLRGGRLPTGRSFVELDGLAIDSDARTAVLVEVYAHVGPVKAAQRHKVHADVFKLALARSILNEQGYRDVKAVFVFVCDDCARSLTGRTWVADAAERFGVETMTIVLSEELGGRLRAAQLRQNLIET